MKVLGAKCSKWTGFQRLDCVTQNLVSFEEVLLAKIMGTENCSVRTSHAILNMIDLILNRK